MSGQEKHFSPEKIFVILFLFTAIEVAWGYMMIDAGRPLLWGGLISCAIIKGVAIAQYFMHLKFEGWIVKGLIAPTPLLIGYIMVMVSPDISRNEKLVEPIGAMVDRDTGEVVQNMRDLTHSTENRNHGSDAGGEGH